MKTLCYSLVVFLDVADIVATHCARPHVTDERKQLVLWRGKEEVKSQSDGNQYVNVNP
jgi:hypothetical protein